MRRAQIARWASPIWISALVLFILDVDDATHHVFLAPCVRHSQRLDVFLAPQKGAAGADMGNHNFTPGVGCRHQGSQHHRYTVRRCSRRLCLFLKQQIIGALNCAIHALCDCVSLDRLSTQRLANSVVHLHHESASCRQRFDALQQQNEQRLVHAPGFASEPMRPTLVECGLSPLRRLAGKPY